MKSPETPRSQIVHSLRQLWLRSRERAECLKKANYTCQNCGKKKSQKKGFEQKVEVHHKEGILNWDEIVEVIKKDLLCSPDKLEALCPECHDRI
jgi:predicted HNH restriction endonuclease